MSTVARATAKGYFNTGDVPTETQFANLLDSLPFLADNTSSVLTDASTTVWAYSSANRFKRWTIGGDRTLSVTGTFDGDTGLLLLTQDGTGSRTPTLPGNKKTGLTFSTGAGNVDLLTFVNINGTLFWDIANFGTITPGLTALGKPVLTATAFSSTQINLSWPDIANETAYEIWWNGTNSFGSASLLTTKPAGSTSHSHTGLSPSSTFYYWLVAVGDGVTYSNGPTSDVATTATLSTGPSLQSASFTSPGLLTNAAGTWTASVGASNPIWTNRGVDTVHTLTANGYIEVDFASVSDDDDDWYYGLTNSSSLPADYTNIIVGVRIHFNGSVELMENGGTGNVVAGAGTFVLGNKARLSRTGSVWKLQKNDAGTITDIATSTITTTATMYPMCDIFNSTYGKIVNPKIYS